MYSERREVVEVLAGLHPILSPPSVSDVDPRAEPHAVPVVALAVVLKMCKGVFGAEVEEAVVFCELTPGPLLVLLCIQPWHVTADQLESLFWRNLPDIIGADSSVEPRHLNARIQRCGIRAVHVGAALDPDAGDSRSRRIKSEALRECAGMYTLAEDQAARVWTCGNVVVEGELDAGEADNQDHDDKR